MRARTVRRGVASAAADPDALFPSAVVGAVVVGFALAAVARDVAVVIVAGPSSLILVTITHSLTMIEAMEESKMQN